MGLAHSPTTVMDGLVLFLDAANPKSYPNYNLATYSQDFENAAYTNSAGLVTATGILAPDGTLTATTMTDDTTGTYDNFSRSFAVQNDSSSYNISIHIKKTTGGTSTRTGFNISLTGGTTPKYYNIRFNSDTGAAGGGDSNLVTSEANNYWRLSFVVSNNSTGNTALGISYYPATGVYNGADDPTAMGSQTVWGFQVTRGAALLPYNAISSQSATDWLNLSGQTSSVVLTNGPRYLSTNSGVMDMDGTDDYADFDISGFSATACTVELWANIRSFTAVMPFGWNQYDVYCNTGDMGFNTAGGDVYGITSTQVTSLGLANNWKHYAFVMRSDVSYTNNKIYVNTVQQTLSQIAGTENAARRNFNSGSGRISGWRFSTLYRIPMSLGSFKVYNRELSSIEIQQNFNATKGRYGV